MARLLLCVGAMENAIMNPLNLRLMTSHALAMAVAALLALALGGCGSESGEHATSVTPEVAAGSHESVPPLVSNTIDLDEPEVAPAVQEPVVPEPAVREPVAEAAAADIEVRRIIATTGIENREPVEARERFDVGELEHNGRVYAFFDVRNESDAAAHVNAVFVSPSGRAHGQVELTIPANARRWRTWAYTRALATGTWDIELRAADGTVLSETRFEVQD
ncbi:MAG: DUF2914 domain-containing protein [Polyangiales bacterium]